MSAGADRDALVAAMLALRDIANHARAGNLARAYARACDAARQAEAALNLIADGCASCGGDVEPVPIGRPRRYCHGCRPPRMRAEVLRAGRSG